MIVVDWWLEGVLLVSVQQAKLGLVDEEPQSIDSGGINVEFWRGRSMWRK